MRRLHSLHSYTCRTGGGGTEKDRSVLVQARNGPERVERQHNIGDVSRQRVSNQSSLNSILRHRPPKLLAPFRPDLGRNSIEIGHRSDRIWAGLGPYFNINRTLRPSAFTCPCHRAATSAESLPSSPPRFIEHQDIK